MANQTNTVARCFAPVDCADCGVRFDRTGSKQKRCQPCQFTYKRAARRIDQLERYHRRKAAEPPRLSICKRCGDSFPSKARKIFCEPCKPFARKESMNAWAANNREKARAKVRRYNERNREKVLARRAKERARDREKLIAYSRSEHRRTMVNAWEREHRASNPGYDISKRISHGIRLSMQAGKSGRRWETLVGYSLNDLMLHLERQFAKGMSWANRSEWHIDHILPLASFDFATPECPGFKAAWALTNLRPLWSGENVSKGAKRTLLI